MSDFIEENIKNSAFGTGPMVAILMGTFNGARFLPEQLDSLASQTHQNWVLIVSDDGSADDTIKILSQYQERWPQGKLIIRNGPQKGYCVNFLSLACDSAISADFYAFCDQDDVWLSTKLAVAIQNISENQEENIPYVYCGRTTYVNERLKKIGCSPLFAFPKTFRNALVQSIAGGNTMVFNRAAKRVLEEVGIIDHSSHDWWLYQLVTGVGGFVFFDQAPQVLYRQHKNSLIGSNHSFCDRIVHILGIFKGVFRQRNNKNIAILCSVKPLLNHGSKETLELFKKMRGARLKDRFRLLEVAGLYRQTWRGTVTLILAAILKKI